VVLAAQPPHHRPDNPWGGYAAHTSPQEAEVHRPWRAGQGYANVRLIVRAVGVNAPATAAQATCVACGARERGLRSGEPAASVAGRTMVTWP